MSNLKKELEKFYNNNVSSEEYMVEKNGFIRKYSLKKNVRDIKTVINVAEIGTIETDCKGETFLDYNLMAIGVTDYVKGNVFLNIERGSYIIKTSIVDDIFTIESELVENEVVEKYLNSDNVYITSIPENLGIGVDIYTDYDYSKYNIVTFKNGIINQISFPSSGE